MSWHYRGVTNSYGIKTIVMIFTGDGYQYVNGEEELCNIYILWLFLSVYSILYGRFGSIHDIYQYVLFVLTLLLLKLDNEQVMALHKTCNDTTRLEPTIPRENNRNWNGIDTCPSDSFYNVSSRIGTVSGSDWINYWLKFIKHLWEFCHDWKLKYLKLYNLLFIYLF